MGYKLSDLSYFAAESQSSFHRLGHIDSSDTPEGIAYLSRLDRQPNRHAKPLFTLFKSSKHTDVSDVQHHTFPQARQ